MTFESYGKIWCLDHCLAVAYFNLLDGKKMKKCFNWIILRPMFVKDIIINGDKIDEIVSITRNKGNLFHEVK